MTSQTIEVKLIGLQLLAKSFSPFFMLWSNNSSLEVVKKRGRDNSSDNFFNILGCNLSAPDDL